MLMQQVCLSIWVLVFGGLSVFFFYSFSCSETEEVKSRENNSGMKGRDLMEGNPLDELLL